MPDVTAPTTLTLVRRWTVNTRPTSSAEHEAGRRHETAVGHPQIPHEAMAALRDRVMDHPRGADPTRWWRRDGLAWDAVVRLHQAGRHHDAVALARLLDWCDRHGSHDDHTMWEIREERPTHDHNPAQEEHP